MNADSERSTCHDVVPDDRAPASAAEHELFREYAAAINFLLGCGATAFTGELGRPPIVLVHRGGSTRSLSPVVWQQIEADLRSVLRSRQQAELASESTGRGSRSPVAAAIVPNPAWEDPRTFEPPTYDS
jgi:hypothetical protein